MPEIDFKAILTDSITAIKAETGKGYSKLKPYAEHEVKQFAENAVFLAKLKLAGTIGDEEFKVRMEMQRLAFTNVFLAVKGIGLVTAQNIVNGVLGILSQALKTALKITLPI